MLSNDRLAFPGVQRMRVPSHSWAMLSFASQYP